MNNLLLLFIAWILEVWEWYIAMLGPLFLLFREGY